jgi:hypothetical protein
VLRKMTATMLLKHGKNYAITIHSQGYYFEGDGSQNLVKPAFLLWSTLGTFWLNLGNVSTVQ